MQRNSIYSSLQNNAGIVTNADFDSAIMRSVAGIEKKRSVLQVRIVPHALSCLRLSFKQLGAHATISAACCLRMRFKFWAVCSSSETCKQVRAATSAHPACPAASFLFSVFVSADRPFGLAGWLAPAPQQLHAVDPTLANRLVPRPPRRPPCTPPVLPQGEEKSVVARHEVGHALVGTGAFPHAHGVVCGVMVDVWGRVGGRVCAPVLVWVARHVDGGGWVGACTGRYRCSRFFLCGVIFVVVGHIYLVMVCLRGAFDSSHSS